VYKQVNGYIVLNRGMDHTDKIYDMKKDNLPTRILVFETDKRQFGLFEDGIEKIKRYSDKALASLVGNVTGDECGLRSFREYLSIPDDPYGTKPFLIRPFSAKTLLTVDLVRKRRIVRSEDILSTKYKYIKEVKIARKFIPLFKLSDLLTIEPPFAGDVLESLHNGGLSEKRIENPNKEKLRKNQERLGGASHGLGSNNGKRKGTRRYNREKGPIWFFSISLLIVLLVGYFIFKVERTKVIPYEIFPSLQRSADFNNFVTPYLSYSSKMYALENVYRWLRLERAELLKVERELVSLESGKSSYYENMDQKEDLYWANISALGLGESEKGLRSIVDLVKRNVDFRGETQRRESQYFALYEKKKAALLLQKQEHEKEIGHLTHYMKSLASQKEKTFLIHDDELIIDEIKSRYLESFLVALNRGDYEKALHSLEIIAGFPFSESEKVMKKIIIDTLQVLKEYSERIAYLQNNSPFDDIKLSYLNENYSEAWGRVKSLESKDYLKPILSGLEGALHSNLDTNRRVEKILEGSAKAKEAAKKAESLKNQGEYNRAVEMYEDLLMYSIPSYDQEYILRRIRVLWLDIEKRRMTREENTRAIKYLESARLLNNEGKEKEALAYYEKLIIECPNSDYKKQALREIMMLVKIGNPPE
jgi:hypothetical protein